MRMYGELFAWPSTLKSGRVQQDRVIERVRELATARVRAVAESEIAQQHEARILALDLARVDAGLHEQDSLPDARAASGVNSPPLAAITSMRSRPSGDTPKRVKADPVRRRRGEALEIRVRLRVVGCRPEVRGFGGRRPVGAGGARRQYRQQEQKRREARASWGGDLHCRGGSRVDRGRPNGFRF